MKLGSRNGGTNTLQGEQLVANRRFASPEGSPFIGLFRLSIFKALTSNLTHMYRRTLRAGAAQLLKYQWVTLVKVSSLPDDIFGELRVQS